MEVLWNCMKATHGLEGDCLLPTVLLHHHPTTSKIQPPSLTAIYSESPEKSQTVQPVFLMDVLVAVKYTQLCQTLCGPMDSSPPGPSVHGILQVRILEWVAISFCRGSSQPRDWIWVAHFVSRLFTDWTTREDQCYCSRMLEKMKDVLRYTQFIHNSKWTHISHFKFDMKAHYSEVDDNLCQAKLKWSFHY